MDSPTLLAHTPALPPPVGISSNFDNPPSRGEILIITCSIFMSLMIVFVILRVYSRLWISRSFGWDDYACVVASAFSIGYTAVVFDLAAHQDIGRHQWDIRAIAFSPVVLKKLLILQVGYPPAIFFTKLALFLMYLRIFSPSLRTRYLIYFGIPFLGLFYTACLLVEVISCTPRSGETWLEATSSKRCNTDLTLGYVMAAFNVTSDFYLLAIPIPVVWKLQLPLRKKIGVSAVFMTGLLACLCSVVNVYYRVRAAQSLDATWTIIPILITSVVEINVGLMAGCMPHLTSLYRNQILKTLRPFSFRYLKSMLVYPWSRRSKGESSERSNEFSRLDSHPQGNDIYLETRILGSMQGRGKFLDSGVHPQKEWVDRNSRTVQSHGPSTVRETWGD